jgi:TonB family protein
MHTQTLAPKTLHSRMGKSILPFVVISFLLHLSFLAVKYQKMAWNPSVEFDETVIKVNLQALNSPKKQIVQTVNSQDKQIKERAFLSEANNSFERETVAKKIATFKEAGLGQEQGQENTQNVANKNFALDKVKLGKEKDKMMQQMLKEAALPQLGSSRGNKELTGLAQSNDFVEEIPLGDLTKLNTVEYKFYGFYFRIKQKLEQYWGLSIKEKADKIFRQGRSIASDTNHVTSLIIAMDPKGKIIDVKVKSPSGVNELDEAAVESFNRAGPFPNPPKEMVKNGKVIIEWGFVVKS